MSEIDISLIKNQDIYPLQILHASLHKSSNMIKSSFVITPASTLILLEYRLPRNLNTFRAVKCFLNIAYLGFLVLFKYVCSALFNLKVILLDTRKAEVKSKLSAFVLSVM